MYATIDIETTGLNRYTDEVTLVGIGLAHSADDEKFFKTYILDMSKPEHVEKLKRICKKLKEKKAKTVFQNGKFDTLFLEWKYRIKLAISEDIMLMGTTYDLAEEHGLKEMAKRYLGVEDWDIDKKTKLGKGDKKVLKKYLKYDVTYTWQLFRYFNERMNETQWKLYKKILRPAYRMYRDVERKGIYFDHEDFKRVQKKYRDIEAEKLAELKSHYDINWNSPQQKAKALFTDEDGERLPILKLTPTGNPSSDASTLKKLAAKGYGLPQLMLDYTAANTLNKMFLNRWGQDSSYDGRIHPCFNLTNVVSGRTSCLVGDAQVMIPSGIKSIKDVVVGDLVYTKTDDGDLTLNRVTWSGCTGIRNDLYKIYYKTQGEHKEKSLILTSDHLVSTVEKGFIPSKELRVGDRLNALHRGLKSGRYHLYWTGNKGDTEHRVVFRALHGYLPEHIHHIDKDKLNNNPENLIGLTAKEHTSLHAQGKTSDEMRKVALCSHNEKWKESMKIAREKQVNDMTKQQVIDALIKGNGQVGAAKLLKKDLSYVKNRMKYWGIHYDGRKPKGQRLILKNNHYITKIEKLNMSEKVYDITVEQTHNFYANEICVHNCTDPNLQQVPRTPDVRGLFHAPEGRCFFEADYSQLELRIAAHYANEQTMLRIYNENGDIHTETALLLTGGREPTKDERRRAKAVNFGFLYGMGAKKFVEYAYDSYGVVFTLSEAERFRELFFAKYSGLLPWHEKQRALAEALGGVPNLFGRFRKLPNIYSTSWKDKGSAERVSINTPVQGTGSDILLSAAIQIKKELEPEGLCIVGTVHDSILGEFPEDRKDWFESEIRRIMKHPALLDEFGVELKCPLDCDVGVGKWGTH